MPKPPLHLDLSALLQDWPYEPGQINVRLIQGDDSRPKIQMRVDLGILQMEVEGRPDGRRPDGFDSLLEMHETLLDEHTAEHGSGEGFKLDSEACRLLREESVQYYHRYISLLVLEDYEAVVRDVTHNLAILDLCGEYGETEDDRAILEQFRPYLLMMRTRALASQAVSDGEPRAALVIIDDGLDQIRESMQKTGEIEDYEQAAEVQLLRGMRDALTPKLPVSQKDELRKRLKQALLNENYELAAILRDELRMLPD